MNGSMVKPGQITYDPTFHYVKLDDNSVNPAVFALLNPADPSNAGKNLVVIGSITQVQAQIVMATPSVDATTEPTTLFVKYLNSGTDKVTKTFQDLEQLALVDENGVVGQNIVTLGNTATGVGSAASIGQGIYYINGFFCRVEPQTIICSKYSDTPSAKVGLTIVEREVSPEDDASLLDNAAGSPNYTAPGAYRYAIDLILDTRALDSTDDTTFVELLRLDQGVKQKLVDKTEYSIVEDFVARGRYDTNGDFTVSPFKIDIRQHLNNGSNLGVFSSAQGGQESLLAVGLEPGKAYVKGYEIETITTQFIPLEKARDSSTTLGGFTRAYLGNYILINGTYNFPTYDTYPVISLCDAIIATPGTQAGNIIGTARARQIEYDSGASSTLVHKLFLFDISLNAGKTIDNVLSVFSAGSGPAVNFTSNVCSELIMRNVVGAFVAGDTLDGSGFTSAETVISWDASTGSLIVAPATANVIADNAVVLTHGNTHVTASTLFARDKIFDASHNVLVYPLPQSTIKTVKDQNGVMQTSYAARKTFTATATSSTASFAAGTGETFAPFSIVDYVASDETSGAIITLTSGNVTFADPTHVSFPATTGHSIKLSATVQKSTAGPKGKQLVVASPLVVSAPAPTTIALGKPDIYQLISVVEATVGDITSRYTLDNGQRDTEYNLGSIKLNAGEIPPSPSNNVTVTFSYFNHTGSGDYFCVDSYTSSGVTYDQIPNYVSQSGATYNLRDCFDFRPRMNDGGTAITGPTPLVKSNSDILSDFQYYLNRVDKVYLDYKGNFGVIKGTSSLTPLPPADPKDGMLLYILTINAYTFSERDLNVKYIENKRYTMRDIGKLETRIDKLEYYTSLNLLEQHTANLNITDTTTGLDRFKNGFVVDPFTGHNIGDVFDSDYAIAIDAANGIARPTYTSDAIDLLFDTPNSLNYEYRGIKPENDLLTVKYTEIPFITQPYASLIENLNPYAVYSWAGTMVLNPPNDTWKDTARRPDVLVNDNSAFDNLVYIQDSDGVLGTVWNEWQTDWTGVSETSSVTQAGVQSSTLIFTPGAEVLRRSTADVTTTLTTTASNQSRTGIRTAVVPQVVRQTVDSKVVDLSFVPSIRTRYVKFTAKGMKPNTQVFPFFDNVDVSSYCKPIASGSPDDPTVPGPESGLTAAQRKLFTDIVGNVTGWFDIPNTDTLFFRTGQRVFRLTDDANNASTATTFANATYTAAGVLETVQNTITSVRVPEVVTQTVSDTRVITNTQERTSLTNVTSSDSVTYLDPLAETFLVSNMSGGVVLSKIGVFFQSRDASIPVTLQIREVVNGYPSPKVVPFSTVTLPAASVNVSDDGTVETQFAFSSPVYLQNNTEYAFVLMSNSNNYNAWCARLGDKQINSDRIISEQPYAGVLFKSQNASTWTAEQLEDLKFTIYRCKFATGTGNAATLFITNDNLPVTTLPSASLQFSQNSPLIRVLHKNHGMPVGSSVTIGIDATEYNANTGAGNVYNGINVHNIINAPGVGATQGFKTYTIANVRLDYYTINCGSNATSSGIGGPANITVTANRQMDVLYPLIQQLSFSNTQLDWTLQSTSGKSIDGTQTQYAKNAEVPVVVNQNIQFNQPQIVASLINESTLINIGGAFANKSLVLKATMQTSLDNISPLIDTKRMSAIAVGNRIDNSSAARVNLVGFDDFVEKQVTGTDISFSSSDNSIHWTGSPTGAIVTKYLADRYIKVTGATNTGNNVTMAKILSIDTVAKKIFTDATLTTESAGNSIVIHYFDNFVDETATTACTNPARYIERRITLQDPANSLKVYITAMRPGVSSIDVYYRVLPIDTNTNYADLKYTKLTIDPQIDSAAAASPTDFKEYTWSADQIGDFISMSIKVVLKSTDSTQVPLLKDFRAIALGT